MSTRNDAGESLGLKYHLVKSYDLPEPDTNRRILPSMTQVGEDFHSDFNGASRQFCRDWMLENQKKYNFFEKNIFVIVDGRSTTDDTITVQYWKEGNHPPLSPLEFPGFGILPPKYDAWYEYRIDFRGFQDTMVGLQFLPPDISYPVYYGRKADLTDENGVFDVARAKRMRLGEERATPEG